jgi:hypothetical protein
MNRQQFNSRNDIGQVLVFQKSGLTSSFTPQITFPSSTRRVSWKLNNGIFTEQIAGNSLTYTGFTSDSSIRSIEMRGNSFTNMSQLSMVSDNIYGNLDLRPLNESGGAIVFNSNPNLTGITMPYSNKDFNGFQFVNCNLIGNLDMTPISGDVTSLTLSNNLNLTSITHNNISKIGNYVVNNCNLQGTLNLPFSGLGPFFQVNSNSGLTNIIHAESNKVFQFYDVYSCGIIGNLDLSKLYGLGGNVRLQSNPNLTGITHPPSSQVFLSYQAENCNLTGNLDFSPLSGFGGVFSIFSNQFLTGITHTTSLIDLPTYRANNCDITGVHDLSMFQNLGRTTPGPTIIRFSQNLNLTNIILPNTTKLFRNGTNNEDTGIFGLYSCNLDYMDFKPLSGATLLTGTTQGNPRISLRDNNMSAGDVNHILVDFSGNTSVNPSGWSNVNLNIGGSNADPDSSSGGYDGLAAIAFLTGSPYNWTITY